MVSTKLDEFGSLAPQNIINLNSLNLLQPSTRLFGERFGPEVFVKARALANRGHIILVAFISIRLNVALNATTAFLLGLAKVTSRFALEQR